MSNKPKAWMGIDPGIKGAAALIHDDGQEVFDWPGDPSLAADKIREWILEYDVRLAALESVSAMPKQGVSSTFKFGQNLGQWQGILSVLPIPYLMPRPREWQKGLVRPSDGKDPKERSLTVARRLFPDAELSRKKDHNRADALLLAWWARKQEQNNQ
jgi:crossover junction endodeoxyribonuclease RuvC